MKKILAGFSILCLLMAGLLAGQYFGGVIQLNTSGGGITITNSVGINGLLAVTDYINVGHQLMINDLWAIDGQGVNLILNPSNQWSSIILNTNVTVNGGLSVNGSASGLISLYATNGANYAQLSAFRDVGSNSTWFLPTNNMGGNFVGILTATNAGATSNQIKVATIGSGLSFDGATLSASASGVMSSNAGTGYNITVASTNTAGISLNVTSMVGQTNYSLQVLGTNGGSDLVVYPNTHRVGIGTNVPTSALQVAGGITMQKGGYGNGALMSDGGSYLYFDTTGFTVVNNSGGVNFNVSNDGFGGAGYAAIASATISRFATGSTHLKVGDASAVNGTNSLFFGNTINTTATTGITMNRQTGRVKIASGSQTYLLTNNLATTSSAVLATVNTDDATAFACKAIPTAGLITLKLNGVAAADTEISFFITSP